MVSSNDYTIFKFGGSSLKNEEYGIKMKRQLITGMVMGMALF